MIVTLCTGSAFGSTTVSSAWPASWIAVTRFSASLGSFYGLGFKAIGVSLLAILAVSLAVVVVAGREPSTTTGRKKSG
jgi:hypothetical protein